MGRSEPLDSTLARIDTCQAGADDQQEVLRQRFADLNLGLGAHVIAASGELDQADESDKFGDIFTFSVLERLRGKADANSDRMVHLSELRDYVE